MSAPVYSGVVRHDEIVALARQLLRDITDLYLTDTARSMKVAHEVIELAALAGNQQLTALSYLELGKAVRQNGDLDGALDHFSRACDLFETIGDMEHFPRALQAQGTVHSAIGNLGRASECFAQALPIAQANNDLFALERIWNSWGIVYIRNGDYAAALSAFETCLHLLQTFPDLYLESSVLLNIGAIFQRSGQLEVTIDYGLRSLQLGRDLNDTRHIISSLIILGDTYHIQSKPVESRECLREALSLAESLGAPDLISTVLKSLAEVASEAGQFEEALQYLVRSKELIQNSPGRIHLQKIEQELGSLYLQTGKLDKAAASLEHALELAKETGSPQLIYETDILLSELATKQLDFRAAYTFLREALDHHKHLFSESNQKAIRDLQVRTAMEARKKELLG